MFKNKFNDGSCFIRVKKKAGLSTNYPSDFPYDLKHDIFGNQIVLSKEKNPSIYLSFKS